MSAILAESYGRATKCAVCKDDITGSNCYRLENNLIHTQCYKCSKCKAITTPDQAQIRGQVITCTPCYGKFHWKKCSKCSEPMKPSDILTVLDKQMHQTCYRCDQCKTTMAPGRQYMIETEIFCNMNCAKEFRTAKYKTQQQEKQQEQKKNKSVNVPKKSAAEPPKKENSKKDKPPADPPKKENSKKDKPPPSPAPEAEPTEPVPPPDPPA